MAHRYRISIRLLVLFILLWALWTARLGAKFYGEQDSFRTWMPAAARNYSIYDYDDIGFMVVRDTYIKDVAQLNVYSHHPPLSVWLPALLAQVAGHHEVSLRYIFPAAMLIASAAFFVLVKHLYGERVAFWSVFFFGITPFIAFFETSYGHDPLGFMALMLFAAIYTHWLKRPTRLRYIGLIATTILATWSAWPTVIFVGVLGICGLFFGGWQQRVRIVVLGIVSVLSIVAMVVLYEHWWAGSFKSLMEAYVWRSSSASLALDSEAFSVWQWLSRNFMDVVTFGSLGLVVLAFIGGFFLYQCGTRYANAITVSLLLAAVVYFLVFRNATYVHHYYKAFLMPVMAIAAAVAVVYGRARYPRVMRPLTDGFIFIFVAQSLYLLFLMVQTAYDEPLTNIINYINSVPNKPERIVVQYTTVHPNSEYAVEYYTMQPIDWITDLDEVEAEEDVLYILCDENQQYVSDFYPDNPPVGTQIDELCTAYDLGVG